VGDRRFLVALPTYNERDNLPRVVEAIAAVRHEVPFEGDVLVIDDNSPDGTGSVADRLAAEIDWLQVLHRPAKLGLGPAYVAGFRWALERDYSHVLQMDADLSHPVSALPRMLAESETADLALGSRYVDGGEIQNWGVLRRAISAAGSLYARVLLSARIRDLTGGFKCYRADVLRTIDLDSIHTKGYAFQIETTYRALQAGFHVVEVPIRFVDREVGGSKMSRAIVLEAIWKVPALRIAALTGKL
jgi:dolichol-phosphate mannosyltransferase